MRREAGRRRRKGNVQWRRKSEGNYEQKGTKGKRKEELVMEGRK